MLVCGVDEAGRGSMLGPLVIAGVSIPRSRIRRLSSMGVRDSKQLSAKRRAQLYKKIIEFADDYYVSTISPRTIDRSVHRHELNRLEAKYMARVIARLRPDVSYVDSCDVNPKRFGSEVSRLSENRKVHSHHRADAKYAIVSAASIIAKVSRDREISRLKRRHDVGSGYPSDSKTVKFVRDYIGENNSVPPFVRTSWRPVRAMLSSWPLQPPLHDPGRTGTGSPSGEYQTRP